MKRVIINIKLIDDNSIRKINIKLEKGLFNNIALYYDNKFINYITLSKLINRFREIFSKHFDLNRYAKNLYR